MKNLRWKKPQREEKKIHYVKNWFKKIKNWYKREEDTSNHYRNIIIITLKTVHHPIYIYRRNPSAMVTATTIDPPKILLNLVSQHMLYSDLFRSNQIKFRSPNSNILNNQLCLYSKNFDLKFINVVVLKIFLA